MTEETLARIIEAMPEVQEFKRERKEMNDITPEHRQELEWAMANSATYERLMAAAASPGATLEDHIALLNHIKSSPMNQKGA